MVLGTVVLSCISNVRHYTGLKIIYILSVMKITGKSSQHQVIFEPEKCFLFFFIWFLFLQQGSNSFAKHGLITPMLDQLVEPGCLLNRTFLSCMGTVTQTSL